ncbi:SH3 domain-containing protein [Shouchella clausii]|uniref:SH3 domain-containing protein n=1 Tax=Shouchella clausii TaxID=79880 RepID=UPI0034E93365
MFPIQKKLMLAGSSASIVALVASALPLQSAYASSITVKETHYNSSFDAVVDRQMGLSARPQTDKNGRWENASRSDVAYYMNANNFKQGTSSYLQFLNLSSSAGLSAGTINSQLLSDKGILQGQGQAFINASKLYGVNEIYLISHALLETGNGKSQLATGVQVNGKTVYNMYGIGAYDGNAVSAGAQYAYNQGWFTPEDAIIGGARFVSSNYFARGQNTLYKMRWNPANPGTYQYATDVGWAVKQTHHMSNLYSLVDDYEMTFDVPVYKNQPTGDAGNDKLEQLPTGTFGTTTARLNVRTGPGTSHSIVTTLDKDTKVELLAKQGNWYQIAVDNTTGFVSGDYLKLDKPSEDNVEDSDQELISYGETTARLNLRSQPNTSSNVLTTLALGQKLEILKKEGNWYRVRAGHQSGWVSADYVKISSNGVDKESPSLGSATTTARLNLRSGAGTNHSIITTLTKGQKVELLKKQGGWYQVKAGNRTGWVSADYLNVNGSGNVDNAPSSGSATTTARLNLRSGAGTNHSIITTLAKGQKVELLKKQGGWYQVKAGNRTGWVSVDYLNVSGSGNVDNTPSSGSATTTARLNLRSGAGTNHSIITTLAKGQKVELLKKQGGWYQVKAGNRTGWVSVDYLNVSGSGNVDNAPSNGSATTTARLNLRSGAGTNHSIITTLAKGQKVELLKKQGGWYQVKAGNRTGWVSVDYLNVSGSGNVDNAPSNGSATTTARLNLRSGAGTNHSIITTLAKGQKVELLKKQGGWYQVKAGNRTGWVSVDYLNVSGSGNVDNAPSNGSATTTARLNLRSGAGTNHSIITTLAKGQKVELLKKQGGWYQVKAGNRTGWVSADYLNVSNNQAKTESVETVIDRGTTTARLNLRVDPNTSSKIITTLNNGQQLDILKKQGSWYYVKVGSQTGWVSSQYVKLTEAKPTVQVMARTFSFAPIAPEVETNEEANESVNEENDVADLENSPSEKQQPIDEVEKEEDKQDVSPDKERDTDEHAEEPSIDENDTVPHSDEANDQTVEEDDHVADENEQASETTDTENDAENEESNLPASEEAPSEENDSTDESSLEEPQEPETDPSTDEQEPETDASADEQEPETDANTDEQEPETDASTDEQEPETDASADEQEPKTDASTDEQEPETDASTDEQEPETDASADEQEPETDANTDEQEPETDASADEQDLAEQVAEEEHGDADGTSEDQESPVSDTAENNEADENSEPVQEEETDVADDEAEALPEEAEGPSEQDEEPSEATEEQQTTVGQKIQLTENTLLFSEASSDSEQLLELFEDDTIEILEEGTDFVKVKANGVEGWIAVEALAAVLP